MKILFLGDVVGRSGREAIQGNLKEIQRQNQIDFTIVNGENAAGGFGITEDICKDFYSAGVNVITTGNHLWDQKEISKYIDQDNHLLKPYNSPEGTPGIGFNTYNIVENKKIVVVNMLGNIFMKSVDNPFLKMDEVLKKIDYDNNISFIFVDFHAEATSEKVAMGHYLDGRVTAVIGTHQHIPTSDTCILEKGTAYQTDAGMCGDYNSVIGMKKEPVIKRFLGEDTKSRFSPSLGVATICGVIIESNSDDFLAKKIVSIKVNGITGN